MALTSFLRTAATASSAIKNFNLPSGGDFLNQQLSSFASNASSSFTPDFLSNNIQNLQNKLENVASPFTDALSAAQASLPGLSQGISLINPALGNIVGPVSSLLGAISSGSADQTLLSLFDPSANSPIQLGQGSGGTSGVVLGSPTTQAFSTSRLPNPLRNFSSYNYIITLGILSRNQCNSPNSTYRSSGLSTVILSSGGGSYNKRQTTATEDIFGPHGEYFIEDLEIDSIITHNQTTGPSNSTGLSFRIIEPYSMGQFLEACAAAAIENNYQNFTSAPYCLEIKFVGYDNSGNSIASGISPKYVPFMFTDIQFDVSGSGSVYQIEAIPFNEQTTIDQIQELKQDSNLRGETVAELLQTNPLNGLTNVMNSRIETQEEVGAISKGDRYIICFPPQGKDIQDAVDDATARFQSGTLGAGSGNVTIDPGLAAAAGITVATSVGGGGLYEQLKSWANNPANISTIGSSRLVLDVNEAGDRPSAFADLSIDIENVLRPVQRNAESAQMTDTERNFQITQGTRVMEVVTDTIVHSEYGRQIIEGPNQQGQYQWFKVDLKTYVELDPNTTLQTGSDPLIYVYQVKPFLADESFFQGPSRRSTATPILRQNALKTYNYLYTGLNEDVLDFNIEYKMAFFEAMSADLGQLTANRRAGATGESTDNGAPPNTIRAPIGQGSGTASDPNESMARQVDSIDANSNRGGGTRTGQIDAHKINVANIFNQALTNSVSDLINADIEIWGDPYFIPDSGMGNFTDQAVPGAPGVTTSGTIETLNQESFILVNFRLPYDYDSNTGLMTFSRLQRQFSGLYEVISILNKFKDGVFTQTLNVMRRRGQSDEGTGDTATIRESGETDLSQGANGSHPGNGGYVGGRDAERTNSPGSGSSVEGGTSSNAGGNASTIVATGAPTGTTPPNVAYVSGFSAKTRNKALNPRLLQILQSAAEAAGVKVVISSGGQDIYPNGRRVGSRRHDGGFAADVILYDGDRRLRVNDPEELSIVQTFIRAARDAGATAAGAGNGYMSDQTYHIDIADGNSIQPGMRGYGAKSWGTSAASSAGSPAWLRQIMNGG